MTGDSNYIRAQYLLGSSVIDAERVFSLPTIGDGFEKARLSREMWSHYSLLSDTTPGIETARPLLYCRIISPSVRTESSADNALDEVTTKKYMDLDFSLRQLCGSDSSDSYIVEPAAVDTARAVLAELRSRRMAPPELSWLGDEAVIMLWVLGDTKYALTITDGEVGWVVRKDRQTIRRESNMKVQVHQLGMLP